MMSKDKYTAEDPRMKEARSALEGGFWLLVVATYLIISFVFRIWHFSWIIFIIAAAIQQIVHAIYLYKLPSPPPEEDRNES
jgi:hypothetical protein